MMLDVGLLYMASIMLRYYAVAQTVKNLPAVQETQLQSLGQKDPLEKGMAIHSRILAWRFHGQSLSGYSPWGLKELKMTEQLTLHFST